MAGPSTDPGQAHHLNPPGINHFQSIYSNRTTDLRSSIRPMLAVAGLSGAPAIRRVMDRIVVKKWRGPEALAPPHGELLGQFFTRKLQAL